jgi:hypothetical protein
MTANARLDTSPAPLFAGVTARGYYYVYGYRSGGTG